MTYVDAFIIGMLSLLAAIMCNFTAFYFEKYAGILSVTAMFFYVCSTVFILLINFLPG